MIDRLGRAKINTIYNKSTGKKTIWEIFQQKMTTLRWVNTLVISNVDWMEPYRLKKWEDKNIGRLLVTRPICGTKRDH